MMHAGSPKIEITVMGDSWKRQLVAPDDHSLCVSKVHKKIMFDAGASRLYHIIDAALCGSGGGGGVDTTHLFFPDNAADQFVTVSRLQQYSSESTSAFWRDFTPLEDCPTVYRIAEDSNKDEFINGEGGYEYFGEKFNGQLNTPKWFLVIYEQEDCVNDKGIYVFEKEKRKGCEELEDRVKSGKVPDLIFWAPRHLGYRNDTDKKVVDFDGESYHFGQLLSKKIIDKRGSELEPLLKKTIVFLRMDRLTNNGIGRRDDRSIDTCMRGLLMEFENNECMKNLLGQCKAIVISSGIDFAFLIMGGGNGSISQFKTFLRPFRTSDYYRDDLGLIRVNGPLVIASCISLFIKKNCLGSTCDDAIIKALVGGIKDGLWRALLQYHKGYPIAKQEVSNTSEQDIYKAHFLKLYGESEPPKQYGVVAVDVRDKIRKVYEAAEKHRNLSEFTVIWHRLFGGQQNQVEDFKSSVHIDLNLLNLDWQGMTVENRNKFLSSIVCLGLEKMVKEGYKLEEEGQEDQDHQIHFSIARFGNRLTADPDEIRFLRDKQILIKKYLSEKYLSCYEERGIKPLGIAVFGEPGSGKSTGIKQIVKEIYGSDSKNKIAFIECNLAQFTSYEDLAKRLRDAQDAIISDKIPMIFLDEFDSYFENNQYGWFKYLLSLLQDGTFKLDNRIYHIGKSIIVCASGMNRSFREFDLSSWTEGDISRNAVRQAYQMLNAKQKDRCRDIVERGIRNGIIDDDTFIENLKRFRTKKEIDELEKRINVLARRLNTALEAFAKGYDSEIEDMKEQIRILKRINTLVIELKEVEEISKGRDDSSISSREEELRKQLHNDIESYDYSHSNNLEEILDNRVIIEMAKMSDGVLRKFGRMGNFIIEHRKQKEAELRKNKEQFQRVKGPDMVSRLLGCMDIKGPNQVISDDLSKRDTLYLVRRAVTLRSVLEERMDRIFLDKRARINPAVLYALLHIPKYYHGARSISAVIDMSVPSYRDFNSFEPAMVPPVSQLNMHLDGEKFYALMNEYRRKHKI